MLPKTLGQLRRDSRFSCGSRSIKDEMRANLMRKLSAGEPLFQGIVGYDDSVAPAIVNALLSRHDFILLGLRGQAKSRILRQLTEFLDPEIPVIEGSEIHDDPFSPISQASRRLIEEAGDDTPIAFLARDQRYVEKLATPDVTIADILGDLDPIKAAKTGLELSAVDNIHYGLLPRAHRCIFAINELPDLAPKIQVGLFNILQEGDVQIKGFPIRLPLDVLMTFTANPEDYTARGKIITPLKDRIGAEVRTHYPSRVLDGVKITRQEAWVERPGAQPALIPEFVQEIVELIAFHGRRDNRVDHRSGVSQRLPISCLECVVSNAERRALSNGEDKVVARVADIYAALPTITGKLELEYEGELRGSSKIAKELIHASILKAFGKRFGEADFERIVKWFDLGGEVLVGDQTGSREFCEKVDSIQGVEEAVGQLGVSPDSGLPLYISAIEFVLEGLNAQKMISRNPERGFHKEAVDREVPDLFEENRRSFN